MPTTATTFLYWSTADLQTALAELNRADMRDPAVSANRAEICRELAARKPVVLTTTNRKG